MSLHPFFYDAENHLRSSFDATKISNEGLNSMRAKLGLLLPKFSLHRCLYRGM